MTSPDPLVHDPERCATCSGKRHRAEPNLLADGLRDLLEALVLPTLPPEDEPNARWG